MYKFTKLFLSLAQAPVISCQPLAGNCTTQYIACFCESMMTNSQTVLKRAELESGYNYSLQLNRWFLMIIGAWPLIPSTLGKFVALSQVIVCWSTMICILLPCSLYILLEENNISSKLNVLGPLINRTLGFVNYFTLLKRRHDIRSNLQDMQTDWHAVRTVDDHVMMIKYAKFGRVITGICWLIMQGGTTLFALARAMKTVTIVVDNETLTIYPMACPTYRKLIDARFSPTNEIMLVIQFFSSFVVSSSIVSVSGLAAVFATHACGQLNILYARLNMLSNDCEEKDQEPRLIAIVNHHLKVLRFVTRIESIMHKTCLVVIMGSTIVMCLIGYYIIMNWITFDMAKISYILAYLSFSFNVFIFCYIGEILTEQCRNVGQMAYMSNWYKLNNKTARSIVLIIARSSNVIKMTAGKLFQLSITTFGDIIKTSFAYLNILRTMTI